MSQITFISSFNESVLGTEDSRTLENEEENQTLIRLVQGLTRENQTLTDLVERLKQENQNQRERIEDLEILLIDVNQLLESSEEENLQAIQRNAETFRIAQNLSQSLDQSKERMQTIAEQVQDLTRRVNFPRKD
ncbi:MAG: hypothetical protein JW769_01255 [Parachlamydiales bacterium]|nr:hypothetical protein [Parachlamydiales bacterium]